MYTRDQLIAFLNAGQSVIVCKKLYTSAADLPDQNTLDACAVAGQINVLDSFLGLPTPNGLPSNNQTIKYNSSTGAWEFASLSAGGVSDGDKGDITVSASGATWSVDAGVITNTHISASAAIARSKLAALTASRAMVTDGSGNDSVSAVTATELGHVSGVTSAIQTQLDTKQAALVSGTNIKTVNSTSLLGSGDITISASPAGSSGDYQINNGGAFGAGVLAQSSGRLTATPTAASSGVASYFRVITPADATLTASTESIGLQFGGNSSAATVTRQWAAGVLATQRENLFVRPTYSFASASTLTNAATVAITGAPAAGINATITNSYALLIESGVLRVASGGIGVAAVPQSNGIAANGWIDTATGVTILDSNHGFYVTPITSYFDGASSYRDIWKFGGSQGVAFLSGNTTLIAEFKASNGNVYFSGTLDVIGGTVNLKNGTAPTTNFTDGVRLYAEDVASSSTLRVRSEAGNIITFPEITDTLLGVNAQVNAQTGTTYTLVAADNGKVITCNNASTVTVTVPTGLGAGFNCVVMQLGTGQVAFSASGTTLNNRQSHTKIAGRYGAASLVAYVSNTFILSGDTSA